MGTSSSMKEAAAKVNSVGELLDREQNAIARRVGLKAKPIATAAVSPASLSRWGRGSKRGGYQVKASMKELGRGQVALRPTVAPLAALLELGSYKAGSTWKMPKRRGSPRRKRGSVGTYTHENVGGRGAWSKTYPPVERIAPKLVDQEVVRVLGRVF